MPGPRTKLEIYRWLQAHSKHLGWIANVFFVNGGPHCYANLLALFRLTRQGVLISTVASKMPYELLYIDGKPMTPEQMRVYVRRKD